VNELDPNFAPGFAMAAAARWRYAEHFELDDRVTLLKAALVKAYQAAELDPRDAATLCHAAMVHSMLGEHERAISKLEEAVSLNPADALVHHCFGMTLRRAGHSADALPHIDHAIRLSPHDIWMAGMLTDRAFVLFELERYEEALDWARRARLSPHPRTATLALFAAALVTVGRLDEAKTALMDLLDHAPSLTYSTYRQMPFGRAGTMEKIASALRDIGLPE
jgi:tetratricopeptide (TPR) repeat protein